MPATSSNSAEFAPPSSSDLGLDEFSRDRLWRWIPQAMERYFQEVASARVAPVLADPAFRTSLAAMNFERPLAPLEAAEFAVEGLWRHQVHTPHPRYFGLFNPAPTAMGVAGDALVAAFNPQIAAWSHSPFAAEVERHLIRAIGMKFGYRADEVDGVFASGGAEANHTALLCAITHAFPEYARGGARALAAMPTVYVSRLSHDSVFKAARLCGLGTDCVRQMEVDEDLCLNPAALGEQLQRDREAGFHPLLIVATAGSTSAGVIDPIAALAAEAERQGVWLHVDAAWGGLAALVPELRAAIAGVERADSITFDAHKSLSVPMGAGIFLTRHRDILSRTFHVGADYMPRDGAGAGSDLPDPFGHSMQWSRRFIGLKLFLSLAVAGWEGYSAALRHQVAMADLLRTEAQAAGWQVLNRTPLPLVLLGDDRHSGRSGWIEQVAQAAVASGEVWISAVRLPGGRSALRACITNYRTMPGDVRALVACLERCRSLCP